MNCFVYAMLLSPQVMEAVRFGIVGVTTACLYYGIYHLTLSRFHYQIAALLAFPPAFILNFTLHKLWTFEGGGYEVLEQQLLHFSLKKGVFYLLNGVCLYVLVESVGLGRRSAQLILIPGLGIPSYLILKWVFGS